MTALLGRQGDVQSIFDSSLADDKDDTGKALVTQALGALGMDPLVALIVERLSERVGAIFTPGEKFKRTSDSPLVKLQEHLKAQEDHLRELRDADLKGKAIETSVVMLQTERLQLLAEKQAAEADWALAKEREERAARRTSLQEVVDGCRKELGRAERLTAELDSLHTSLSSEEAERSRLKAGVDLAHSTLEATQRLTQSAAEDVARASAGVAQSAQLVDAAHQQRRAELDTRKGSADARLKDIESVEIAVSEAAALERGLHRAIEAAAAAASALSDAQRTLEHATLSATLRELVERQDTATRLSEHHVRERRREDDASAGVKQAESAVADAVSRRDRREFETTDSGLLRSRAELSLLRRVELELKRQSLREQVREMEVHDARGRECLTRAVTSRSSASQLEQEIGRRAMPTKELIASWRALEIKLKGDPVPPPVRRTPLVPVSAGVAAGVFAAAIAVLAMDSSGTVAVTVAIAVAAVIGGAIWAVGYSHELSETDRYEQRRRLSERWTLEVLPSLRTAGLTSLASYEGALAELDRRRAEAQRLRQEADEDDLQAAAAAKAAAPLESRRMELAGLGPEPSSREREPLAPQLKAYERPRI